MRLLRVLGIRFILALLAVASRVVGRPKEPPRPPRGSTLAGPP